MYIHVSQQCVAMFGVQWVEILVAGVLLLYLNRYIRIKDSMAGIILDQMVAQFQVKVNQLRDINHHINHMDKAMATDVNNLLTKIKSKNKMNVL